MASSEMLTTYIEKLSHPLKEIRERSLQILLAKLRLGWELEDELAGTRQLLESLLAWFHHTKPSFQRQALELLLTVIKTKAGTYIVREFGVADIIKTLNTQKEKIEDDAMEVFEDVIDSLQFLNTISSEEDITVPRLPLHEINCLVSDGGSSGYYNLGDLKSSNETLISNDNYNFNNSDKNQPETVIRVLLFPWVDLCSSDLKTMVLVEDALRLLKSIRRCCRFIRDVFLCDFPPEILLNRPKIVQILISISDGAHNGHSNEALHVLLCVTQALRNRLLQLTCQDLIHDSIQTSDDYENREDNVNIELEQISGDVGIKSSWRDDGLTVLKQLPAPQYALDTLYAVISTIIRNVVMVDSTEKTQLLSVKDINTCLCLVESLVELLMDCVNENFWCVDHNTKTYRDLAHKSCMVMRLMGDLIIKYRKSFYEDSSRTHHRMAWLRLIFCAEKLLNWCRASALPPLSMVVALQSAQLDPAIKLFYPDLSARLATLLQNTKMSTDQEYKSKYRELCKIFASMQHAVQFIKNKNSFRSTKKVFVCIKNTLPILELIQSEQLLDDIADVLLKNLDTLDLNDSEWCNVRAIALNLMAHNVEWIRVKFYQRLSHMVISAFMCNETLQSEGEKRLNLLCDVGVLTEICCHGLSSHTEEVEKSASEIMLYLLRGRLILSEKCWWRLLACLLPILPLLHVYGAHETQLGQAICKSLKLDIAECMGVSNADVVSGLVRMLFLRCVTVQLDAAHSLCRLLDDDRYLPPRESLRADILLNALRRIEPQDFNVDLTSSPTKSTQTTGLIQILDVLKQDILVDERGPEVRSPARPTLEPSLRRTTLQQLAVMMRQQALHQTFLQCDGLRIIVATLRMSLLVDDYLAFPECSISCVSILNSVCFTSRHSLAKISDLPSLLIRVILVFPANESAVVMAAQVLALITWAGFVLQELDSAHHRVPALPHSVTERTSLPFSVNSYWNTSPNSEHSYIEWVMGEEEWRAAVRVRWWWALSGRARVLAAAPAPPAPPAPPALQPCARDVAALRSAEPLYCCSKALLALENATSHTQVNDSLAILESYIILSRRSCVCWEELGALPWRHLKRFLSAPPASARDMALLISLLHFIITYMDNVPNEGELLSWIKSSFIGNDVSIISLLSRDQFYPQQTAQEDIEVTQLHIHIVKVLLRCILILEGDYDNSRMESLIKILMACLNKVNLKNFHMLGYLNELVQCLRYALHSRRCKLSEDTLVQCMKLLTRVMSGCATGCARKGEACRLNTLLALLALLRQAHDEMIPVQRWSEWWESAAVRAAAECVRGARAEARGAALHVLAALAHHAQLLPHLTQAVEENSLCEYAARIFAQEGEASAVRAAAAAVLGALAAHTAPRADVMQCEMLQQLENNNFLECCMDIFVDFCNIKEYKEIFEPNVCLSVLERRSELEVRAQKGADVRMSSSAARGRPPPTAALLASAARALHNVSAFARARLDDWNQRGLYRLLFRCASWSKGTLEEVHSVRASVCRALFAATTAKCVRASLASTKDCLHSLVVTLKPFAEEQVNAESLQAYTQALLLLGSLLPESAAADSVWQQLKESSSPSLLHLLCQCLVTDENELQEAALYCLAQLAQSTKTKKHVDGTKDESWVQYYDNVKSSYVNSVGSNVRDEHDCQPEYMAEEICKALINLYHKWTSDIKKYLASQEWNWTSVSACLCRVLSASGRSRLYARHRRLPRTLSAALQAVRDHLAMHGKPNDVIRDADYDPVLRTLYWTLTLIDCSMVECPLAKESFADDGITVSLVRLWPWCMLTEQLRTTLVHLLYTFTNDCPKAWSALCVCASGRSAAGSLCALAVRAPRPLQPRALRALRHCAPHHQCRAIIIKSDVIAATFKACVRSRSSRGSGECAEAGVQCARLLEALARHADGAGAALSVLCPPAAGTPRALRAALMPALAHAAHYHRPLFLQSPDLLEFLSGSLLAGDTAEVVCAARAVWALAANNHKAKLALRSAGVPTAVESALQRLRRAARPAHPAHTAHTAHTAEQRALQLLTYTHTVLQAS
ncbi:hypothetical protein O3G_MSEX002455 [Manduca sexta]|uniref:Rotatin N-terminal domain-containing protein n=1 Tax=Manduca sexta TaxID=7130 RepID=A0A922CDW5_MANSE|nr:hypothetical protein O3G_MSEX002455 [Manduca sexta]